MTNPEKTEKKINQRAKDSPKLDRKRQNGARSKKLANAFEEWENSSPENPSLPDNLQKSTSLIDQPYGLAKELDREIAKTGLIPKKIEKIVKVMNEVSKDITEYCYTSGKKNPQRIAIIKINALLIFYGQKYMKGVLITLGFESIPIKRGRKLEVRSPLPKEISVGKFLKSTKRTIYQMIGYL